MKQITPAQQRLLNEFKSGAKASQGDLILRRPDETIVRYDRRSLIALIHRKLILVEPTGTFWVAA